MACWPKYRMQRGMQMDSKQNNTEKLNSILEKSDTIDAYLKQISNMLVNEPFGMYVSRLAIERDLSIPQLCRRSELNESYTYQVLKGARTPGRDKAIQLAVGLRLDVEGTNKLLRACGKSELYCRNKRDAIIIFSINNGMEIAAVNELLDAQSVAVLGDG